MIFHDGEYSYKYVMLKIEMYQKNSFDELLHHVFMLYAIILGP